MFSETQLLLICNALKGSATKVLTAFTMAGTALDMDGLIKWTRMGRHSIGTALKQLQDYGLVAKQVMAHNRVIWMLATNVFPGMRKVDELGKGSESLQLEENPPTGVVVIVNDSPYLINSVNNNNKSQLEEKPPTGNPESKFSVPTIPSESTFFAKSGRSQAELAVLNNAFKAYKIVGKKKDELLACEWVNAAYVRAHVEFAMAEGRSKEHAVGVAILWMLEQLDQPARRENGHIENCTCAACAGDDGIRSGTGHMDGAFAEYINRRDDEELISKCCWQDDLPEIFEAGPYKGQHMKTRRCGKPCSEGSYKWCEEHYEIGTATYDEESEEV